jgi:hypothetical protein
MLSDINIKVAYFFEWLKNTCISIVVTYTEFLKMIENNLNAVNRYNSCKCRK